MVDLRRRRGAPWVLCPGFIDLHAHLREPGETSRETIESGAEAAAAGGFTQVVAMANTRPVIDTPERVASAQLRAVGVAVWVLTTASVTRGQQGDELVDIAGCAAAGASCFSDDGRNAASPALLADALRAAARVGSTVLVHPEDEEMIVRANPDGVSVTRCPARPPDAEVAAVASAVQALRGAGRGRLHLQHLSARDSVEQLRRARDQGLAVSAEVTPHHLAMWLPMEREPQPPSLRKVNPPLRTQRDREAVVHALRDGVIDAVATDHAPHRLADKDGEYADAAPGMIGLETALATCLTLGAMGGDWLPVLVERLTAGPWRVLGEAAGLSRPTLRGDAGLTCTLFDPDAEWEVGAHPFRSLSANTPLLGVRLRGRVLLTLVDGRVAHLGITDPPIPGFVEAFGDS